MGCIALGRSKYAGQIQFVEIIMSDSVFDRVTTTIGDVLGVDDVVWSLETAAKDVDGWTSIAHIRVMIAIERAFGIRFDTTEATRPENIGQLCELVASKV